MKTPAEILSWITDALASGKTIYVGTPLRVTKVTPKTAAQFAAAGRPIFRASEKSLYMSVGHRYDCIDYCQITAQ
jgi:predicted nicotinamide N-methyase